MPHKALSGTQQRPREAAPVTSLLSRWVTRQRKVKGLLLEAWRKGISWVKHFHLLLLVSSSGEFHNGLCFPIPMMEEKLSFKFKVTKGWQCPTQEARALCMTGLSFKALSQISGYLCIDFQRRARSEKWTLDVFFWPAYMASLFRSLCADWRHSPGDGEGCPLEMSLPLLVLMPTTIYKSLHGRGRTAPDSGVSSFLSTWIKPEVRKHHLKVTHI